MKRNLKHVSRFAGLAVVGLNLTWQLEIRSDTFLEKDRLLLAPLQGKGFEDPGIAFDPASIHFETCLGVPNTIKIALKNIGSEDLKIDGISSSNPKVFPVPTLPRQLLPSGQSDDLTFSFTPDTAGTYNGYYVAHTNKAGVLDTLYVTGRSKTASFRVMPSKALCDTLFAVVGDSVAQPFSINNASNCPLYIEDIEVVPDKAPFTVSWVKSEELARTKQVAIYVQYKPRAIQVDKAQIVVHAKYFKETQQFSVVGKGQLGAFASIEPDMLNFGEVCVGKELPLEVKVSNLGYIAFAIDAITTGSRAFRIAPMPTPERPIIIGEKIFTVTYAPTEKKGNESATFTFNAPLAAGEKTLHVTGTAADLTAPMIIDRTACRILRVHEPVTISASATDNCNSPPTLTLCYRMIGGEVQCLPFDKDGNAVIPADAVTKRGVEYQIEAIDASNNHALEPPDGFRSLPVRVEEPSDLIWLGSEDEQQKYFPNAANVNSYRMISVPLNLKNKTADSVIVNDLPNYDHGGTWLLYDYVNGNYCEYTPDTKAKFRAFIPGRAFWLITTKLPNTLQVGPGLSVLTSPESAASCEIPDYSRYDLEAGWNLVGNPYPFDIAKDACSLNNNRPLNNIWRYEIPDGQSVADWTMPQVLEPWKGYAVRALNEEDVLIFSTTEVLAANASTLSLQKLEAENVGSNWQINIQARAGQHTDRDNYVGVREHALTAWDPADIFEPPKIGEYVAVYFPHRDWPDYPSDYAGDFRPPFAEGEVWEFEVKSNLKEQKISLSIKNGVSFPGHLSVYLYDKNRQAFQNLRENANYTFDNLGELLPGRFELFIGTTDFVQHRTTAITNNLPDEIQLYQNFPNPFNQETIFSFYLPQAALVTLKVFDVLGREVRVLSEGQVWPQGRQFVRWGGEDQLHGRVSSGIYILSLTAKNVLKQKRVLVVE